MHLYFLAYVVNLRAGDEFEGWESTVGILEVIEELEGILEAGGVSGLRLSFGCFGGSLSFGVLTFK